MVDTWRGIFRDEYVLLEGQRFCYKRVGAFQERKRLFFRVREEDIRRSGR